MLPPGLSVYLSDTQGSLPVYILVLLCDTNLYAALPGGTAPQSNQHQQRPRYNQPQPRAGLGAEPLMKHQAGKRNRNQNT